MSDDLHWYKQPNRTLCDCLQEMRNVMSNLSVHNKKRTKAVMATLIEEVQTYANRMEAGLEDWQDMRELHKQKKDLYKRVVNLKIKVEALEEKIQEER